MRVTSCELGLYLIVAGKFRTCNFQSFINRTLCGFSFNGVACEKSSLWLVSRRQSSLFSAVVVFSALSTRSPPWSAVLQWLLIRAKICCVDSLYGVIIPTLDTNLHCGPFVFERELVANFRVKFSEELWLMSGLQSKIDMCVTKWRVCCEEIALP